MQLAQMFERLVGGNDRVRFEAYDGSCGRPGRRRRPPSRCARRWRCATSRRRRTTWAWPGRTSPAAWTCRATCTWRSRPSWAVRSRRCRGRTRPRRCATLGPGVLRRPPVPPQEAPPRLRRGRLHSKARDAAAISHHYDVSNLFYSYVLGPSMAYTCAVFPKADASLEEAQAEKFDLVCRKLGLEPGHAPARRRLRLGRHGGARGRELRGARGRRDAVPPAGRLGCADAGRAWAGRARRGPLPGLPRRARDRVRRGLLDRADRAHRQGQPARRTSGRCARGWCRAAGCSTTASPGRTAPDRPAPAGSSTATSSRTASSRGPARSSRRCTTTGSRCGTRRTCASTTH